MSDQKDLIPSSPDKPATTGSPVARRVPLLNSIRMKIRRRRDRKFRLKHTYVYDWLRSGDIAIDCGANIGETTAKFRAFGATTHCFEPDPFAFGKLTETHGADPLITLHQAGVGTEPGRMKLFFTDLRETNPTKGSISSSLFADKPSVNRESFETVEIIDLCSFIENLNAPIAVLKIDIEGMEVAVINRLLDKGLHKRISLILVETHEDSIPSLADDTRTLVARAKEMRAGNIYFNWK